MRSMSPWHPEEICRMTMVQLLCLGSEKPPNTTTISSSDEFEKLDTTENNWRGN